MSERYPGGIITKTPVTPSGAYQCCSASGIWTLDQQIQYQKQGIWPTAGNVKQVSKWIFSAGAGSGSFLVPTGVTSLTVEAIGGGNKSSPANNAGGGGGGAYAKSVLTVTPGQTVYWSAPYVGGACGCAWVNKSANSAPSSSANGVLAKRGLAACGISGGLGGAAACSIGTITYSGGNGGNGSNYGGGGGGGAAGPLGAGKNGGAGTAGYGGGGGGAGGGSSTNGSSGGAGQGGAGGAGPLGTGGGIGSTCSVRGTYGTAGGGGGGGIGVNSPYGYGGGGGTANCYSGGFGPGGGGGGAGSQSFFGLNGGIFGGGFGGKYVGGCTPQSLIVASYNTLSPTTELSMGFGKSASTEYPSYTIIGGIDSSGDMYIAVWAGTGKLIVTRITALGTVVWQKTFAESIGGLIKVVCDSSFNMYVSFITYSTTPSPTYLNTLIKYNSSGTLQWAKNWQVTTGGIAAYSYPYGMDIDSSGNIWILQRTGLSTQGPLLIKISSAGTVLNAYSSSQTGLVNWNDGALKADPAGYLYIAFSGNQYVGCCCFQAQYQYFGKYNLSLTAQWGKQDSYNGSYNYSRTQTFGITVDSSSNVYWGFTPILTNGRPYVQKFNSSGTSQWVWSDTSGTASDAGYPMDVLKIDASNNNYFTFYQSSGYNKTYSLSSSGSINVSKKINIASAMGNPITAYVGPTNYSISLTSGSYIISGINIISGPTSGFTTGQFGRYVVSTNSTSADTSTSYTSTYTLPAFTSQTITSSSASLTESTNDWNTIVGVI